ncbi:type II toxin-antitoxin system VapC family toxin [Rhizobium grahamii]|uniref:Ribonuclease VapC n=1 Tax=Rhizobium grahamii TaxID=1120045 RepID=A0A5Q0C2K8_9HYPH|nr:MULTISPECIES: type II toxin-antitoxin system VapC family toxin [Rhizobium]QFY59663.1 type II toxin-antitoxin system VapC family toxin [Rhizobium grahamii]QRM51225.1 type II toxin-antitoxin system VapC family toxin [Rhizobium sp. BG6]
MPFVADASIAAAWLLPDEENTEAEAALSRLEIEDAFVPDLFWHEMRNILLVAERRRRITTEDILGCLVRLESLPLRTMFDDDHQTIIRLARKHHLSGYDAAYLALALAQAVPLATMDAKLRTAAAAEHLQQMP